jgi:WD40 repeat protein
MTNRFARVLSVFQGGLLILAAGVTSSFAVEKPEFYQDVYPFLKANCISCHNKTTTKAGLNMETPELMIKGGDSGPSIVPGKSAESLVVEASVHSPDLEMPPPNNKSGAVKLTNAEIAVLKAWIDQGAKAGAQSERQVTFKALAPGIDPIYSVTLSRDGRFAICGRGHRLYLYDLASRQFVAEISDPAEKSGGAHRAMVQSLALSPDGMRLASGSFREVKLWKREVVTADSPAAAAPKPADEALLKKIAETGKVAIVNHFLSADGKVLVTGCADGSVRVWDVASAKSLADLRGSAALTKEMAAHDWTVARETLEQAFQKAEIARIEAQNKALDELLKKAQEAIVAMQKVLPEKEKAVKPAQDAKGVGQKSIDEVLAKIKAAPGGKPDAALEKALKDAQEKLAPLTMTETSALAAVSATKSNIVDAEAEVKRINDSKAKNAQAVAAANAAITTAKQSQDKAAAALTAAKASLTKPSTKPVAVALSPDGWRAAAVFDDGRLTVWAIATGTAIEDQAGLAAPNATLAARQDGAFTATSPDGKARVAGASVRWVLERTLGGEKEPQLLADRVNAVKFSPDGKLLATGGGEPSRSGDLTLFDAATGKATATWKERHSDIVMSLDFSPDGKRLASGAADKIARVTEIATGKQVNLLEGHTHYVMGVAFRADGRVLASGGADSVVISWDMILGERKKKIEGWTKEVTSVQFVGATNQIVTSAGDNRVRIVNDEGGEVRSITGLPDFMQAAASTANGATLVGGGEDSTLRIWNGTDGKELAAFAAK